ncbi:glucokinase [Lutimaribacter marinistellae]|uniref:Glucokinase n=1 Tax=Lutimaribacter marinistellae TaxID=1820329 RepID=A0ABV7TGD7_9RHOB
MTPDRLIADIGGTNSRIALAASGVPLPQTVRILRNDDFAGVGPMLADFLAGVGQHPQEAVIAGAGPHAGGRLRLTNRDWLIDADELSRDLSLGKTHLLNDLESLGHSLPVLADTLPVLHEAPRDGRQALVVGIGTGFNVCPVTRQPDGGVVTWNSELGHAPLPMDIVAHLPELPAGRQTIEELFSGRGYLALLSALGGRVVPDHEHAQTILHADSGLADRFHGLFGTCLGLLLRMLTLAYMPGNGIFLAGSVARAALANETVLKAVMQVDGPPVLGPGRRPALRLFDRDDAALTGLAAFDPAART